MSGDATPDAVASFTGLFDTDRYERALQSGFPLHLSIRFELRRRRSNWFDQTIGDLSIDYVIVHDPLRDEFVLDDGNTTRRFESVGRLRSRIETSYRAGYPPDKPGTFYYRVTVSALTLSDEDVDEVYRWLHGEPDSVVSEDRGFLTRTARRVLIRMAPLPREQRSTNSPTFRWP